MLRSNRSRVSKSKHDSTVQRLARDYEKKGYKVEADVEGYSRPSSVGGYRPDLAVRKGGHETIIEVETRDSVNSARDVAQQSTFKRAAGRSEKRHYKRIVVE